jgi:fermentation-respiration switch protein FrsA (DUF1100 family)
VPSPLRPGRPGEVIRVESVAAPPGARAWRVLYHSRSIDGRDIAVSGLVAAPEDPAPDGGYPVVAWAHGTTGLADKCAPSRDVEHGRLPLPELWLQGYVVAATDYEGLGVPGIHPWLVGESEARGALDAVRAARLLDGVDAAKRTVLYGHSQGGHAALFAGQIARSYAPDLDLRGVVAAAPASELARAAGSLRGGPFFGYVVAAAVGFSAVYPEVELDDVLTPSALADLGVVKTSCIEDVFLAYDRPPGEVLRGNPFERAPWPALLARNSPGAVASKAPILLVQGDLDEQVPADLTRILRGRLCRLGDTVELRMYATSHGGVVDASYADVLTWMDERFAGRPARRSCAA